MHGTYPDRDVVHRAARGALDRSLGAVQETGIISAMIETTKTVHQNYSDIAVLVNFAIIPIQLVNSQSGNSIRSGKVVSGSGCNIEKNPSP